MAEIVQMKFIAKAKELRVYQLAFSLALEVHQVSLGFPKTEQYALADQVRRSSKSICANLAEGFDRQQYSKPEFRRFLMMASSSAAEVITWLDFAIALKYITNEQHEKWATECDQICKMLHKLRLKVDPS